MWYSFVGCVLTVLIGLVVSWVTEKVTETKIMTITKGQQQAASLNEKTNGDLAVFTLETYRKKSSTVLPPPAAPTNHLQGFDNVALKLDE